MATKEKNHPYFNVSSDSGGNRLRVKKSNLANAKRSMGIDENRPDCNFNHVSLIGHYGFCLLQAYWFVSDHIVIIKKRALKWQS